MNLLHKRVKQIGLLSSQRDSVFNIRYGKQVLNDLTNLEWMLFYLQGRAVDRLIGTVTTVEEDDRLGVIVTFGRTPPNP